MKNLPALLREITSNNNGDYFCINSEQKANLNHMRLCVRIIIVVTKKCLRHIILNITLNKILKFTQEQKSMKISFVI